MTIRNSLGFRVSLALTTRRHASSFADEERGSYPGGLRVSGMEPRHEMLRESNLIHPHRHDRLHPQCAAGGHHAGERAYAEHEDRVADEQRDVA